MKKIILIHPNNETEEAVYPLACLLLSAFLIKEGFEPVIFDHNDDEDYRTFIDDNIDDALCIGISAITGSQVKHGIKIAEYIKSRSAGVPVVWGGRHGTAVPDATLKDPRVDILVRGEGEIPFLKLVKALSGGDEIRRIQGVSVKVGGEIIENGEAAPLDLSTVPDLPWHLIDIDRKLKGKAVRSIGIQTGRGCPFTCTYCSHRKVTIEKYRGFTAEYILDNLEPLIRKHNITDVNFYEPHFISLPRRVEEICNQIIRRGLKIRWTSSARANTFIRFPRGLLEIMKKSGCERIGFGFESGSISVLKKIDKKIEPWQILESVKLCNKHGIVPEACFMVGFPFENKTDTLKTLSIVSKSKELCPDIVVHMQGYVPFPGTILYDECRREYGLKDIDVLDKWGDYTNIKKNNTWLNSAGTMIIRLLSGSIYLSGYDYIKKRSDMKHKFLLHNMVKIFYKVISFLFPFKKEFARPENCTMASDLSSRESEKETQDVRS